MDANHSPNHGVVVAVRGGVVDVRFDQRLPPIYSVLHAEENDRVVIEVLSQLDALHVRGIALTMTHGLARGMAVKDTGGPLKAPVGKSILSRMFDVFGNVIDRGAALSEVEWRSVHRQPPSLARRSTKSEIFETGIKVIDVLVPLERGGKAGLFGGAMNARFRSRSPWALAFSFARAIQEPALSIWRGEEAQVSAAQAALYHRATCNRAARRGEYDSSMEHEAESGIG
jgi:vacuolar-type H+-ATPase catalytic subunit A/Vma1